MERTDAKVVLAKTAGLKILNSLSARNMVAVLPKINSRFNVDRLLIKGFFNNRQSSIENRQF